jgi:hypothetical protein
LLDASTGEPLFKHFGIHVRCLVAIPLFILCESMASDVIHGIIGQFRKSGIIGDNQKAAFVSTLNSMARLRDNSWPWICVVGFTLAWIFSVPHANVHEMSWATTGTDFGFGGLWFLYIAKPIFIVLLLGWVWRIVLVVLLFYRISKLDLSLTPSHPDQCGGLGFLKKLPMASFFFTLAVSSILASRWMHDMLYHDQTLAALKLPFGVFVVVWVFVALSPSLMFVPRLLAMKREAMRTYGALISQHGRLVHQRWILGQTINSESAAGDILDAPELGPVVDISAIYDAVKNVKPVPIDKGTLMLVLIPICLPMIFVITREIPLKDLLLNLIKTVI